MTINVIIKGEGRPSAEPSPQGTKRLPDKTFASASSSYAARGRTARSGLCTRIASRRGVKLQPRRARAYNVAARLSLPGTPPPPPQALARLGSNQPAR
eukprot:7217411-Prymnesium_polylepis.1